MKALAVSTACLLGTASFVHAADAHADRATAAPEANDPSLRPIFPERRSGLVLGASAGVGLAGASGYPNNAKLIGDPNYYSSSALLGGWSSTFFVMGALTDYLSIGPMFNVATFENAHWKSTGIGLGFRAETFPLIALAPRLADLSLYGEAGVGTTDLRAKGPYPTADGVQSYLALGLHHEWRLARLLGGHAAIGPFVEYVFVDSVSASRHWASLGLRVAWYGGGVKLDQR